MLIFLIVSIDISASSGAMATQEAAERNPQP